MSGEAKSVAAASRAAVRVMAEHYFAVVIAPPLVASGMPRAALDHARLRYLTDVGINPTAVEQLREWFASGDVTHNCRETVSAERRAAIRAWADRIEGTRHDA